MVKRASFLAIALTFVGGCAGTTAHQKAYIAGSVAKQVVTESHEIYSERLNDKVDECDPDANSTVGTEEEFDECLGIYAENDKVVIALEVYVEAADALFKILKDPDAAKDILWSKRDKLLKAAFALIDLLPERDKIRNQLEGIVGK